MTSSGLANLFGDLPDGSFPEELVTVLAEKQRSFRLERIVSKGHRSPDDFWYDQDESELVFVLRGSAVLQFEGRAPLAMKAGDYVLIQPHEKHRVLSTSDDEHCVWLALFFC